MLLRPAFTQETDAISALMRSSKAYWGYHAKQIEEWHDELTMTVEYIEQNQVCVALDESELSGVCSFSNCSVGKVTLDSLFISPNKIGLGVGSALLSYCIDSSIKFGASAIVLDADPNAEGFYLHHGFKTIGKKPSSIAGRFLPIMSKVLQDRQI